MSHEPHRLVQQDADLDQTNNQKTDQANHQDASHQSNPRQELAVASRQSQVDQQRVAVTVQNQMTPAPGVALSGQMAGRMVGRILDATGTGLPDCLVELFFGPPLGVPVTVEESDGLGRFQVEDLPPGFYSLRVVGPDGSTANQWNLRVLAGATCRPQVVLPCLSPSPSSGRTGRRGPGNGATASPWAGESAGGPAQPHLPGRER